MGIISGILFGCSFAVTMSPLDDGKEIEMSSVVTTRGRVRIEADAASSKGR
jgi:hypothetical protein